jgi:hypothetical protein
VASTASPAPTAEAITATPGSGLLSDDERWAAWRAKGIAHERAARRKMAIAAPIVIIVAALIIAAVIAR